VQDRTNLAFAALQLNRDLGFSTYVYGVVRSGCQLLMCCPASSRHTKIAKLQSCTDTRVLRAYRGRPSFLSHTPSHRFAAAPHVNFIQAQQGVDTLVGRRQRLLAQAAL
jgi:hypothetical protein